MEWLLIGIGGSLGAISRYSINLLFKSSEKPFATLLINMLGSFLLGYILAININSDSLLYLFLAGGFLGAFTTFSTFTYETIDIFINRGFIRALIYVSFHFSIILFLAIIGFAISRNGF